MWAMSAGSLWGPPEHANGGFRWVLADGSVSVTGIEVFFQVIFQPAVPNIGPADVTTPVAK